MVTVGQAVVFPAVQRFLGYWGNGDAATLEKQLSQALQQAGLAQVVQTNLYRVEAYSVQSSESAPADVWFKLDEKALILGRDPFGRSPLYWTQTDQVIWFASHLSLLLPIQEARQISIPALYGYSCFSYVPTPLTPIVGIFAVTAGGEQRWSLSQGSLVPQWTRSLEWQEAPDQIADETAAVHQLQTRLKTAIANQIQDLGNEPVGVFLSGGLDSSIVAALLVQAGVKVRAYTLDFGAVSIPEYPYAEMVADFLQIPLVRVNATPQRIRQAIAPTAQALDLPFGDGVTVPLFLLGQAAREEVGVLFNGEGGDQLFAGWTNKPLIAAEIYQTEHPSEDDFTHQYLRTFHRLWGYEDVLFQPEIAAQVKQLSPQDWLQEALNPVFSRSLLPRLRRANLMLKGAQNIQPRATRLGLVHGLQVRSPFCDVPLAQSTFQLSGELLLQGACEKYILKRAVESWLPPEIVWRSKRGMGVPLTDWCGNALWQEIGVWLNPGRLRQTGIWQPDIALQIISGELGTIQGRRIGESLWLLLMWQVWQSVMLGETDSPFSLDHPFWLPSWLGKQYLQVRRSIKQW